ncbi:hypothetical protein PMIN06_011188 [Paraphaeosphaeria minitans]|uniref:Uncharacterized protein n=1 Tax=Paraphaeosphaeria minitans TaxID=565426 RepID=A0A9P6KW38_9PLEO|nr:hypothetical protein PMIN01_01102 [Paraphaeosphaeria minitans]
MALVLTTIPQWCSIDRQGSAVRHGRASDVKYRGLAHGEPLSLSVLKTAVPAFPSCRFSLSPYLPQPRIRARYPHLSHRAGHDNLTLDVYVTYVFGWNVKQMWKHTLLCAILAPGAVVKAAIFAVPKPTLVTPAVDSWNPAPTKAPRFGAIELLRRDDEPWQTFALGGTCGFFDGIQTSAFTCRQSKYQCATNTYYGNHGCCDPYQPASSCTLYTTCLPQTLLSKSCDRGCSSNDYIAKCSLTANPECYEFHFVYTTAGRTTTMKEWGCTDTATTGEIPLTWSGYSTPGSGDTSTSSSSLTSPTTSPTPTETPQQVTKSDGKPNNTPAIIGGVLGGLVIVGALIFAIVFLVLRDLRRKREVQLAQQPQEHQDWAAPPATPGISEVHYSPEGFIGCNVYGEEPRVSTTEDPPKNWKAWNGVGRDKKVPQGRVTSCGEQGIYGAVEAEGRMVHEAPS